MKKAVLIFIAIQLAFDVVVYFRVRAMNQGLFSVFQGISDYNYIAGSLKLPQIGQTPDGKQIPGTHVITNEDYLKEREGK